MMALRVLLPAMVVFALSMAQEREPTLRPQPSSRPADVKAPQTQAQLPKIDLPEFVITGTASINPPDVEKDSLAESGIYQRNPLENLPGLRDRGTIDLGERFRQALFATGEVRNGLLSGSLGTFFSPSVMGYYAVSTSSYGALARAEYYRTKGFARFTDASQASLGVDGNIVLHSRNMYFDETRFNAGLSYDVRKYKFYGSVTPSLQRSWSVAGFSVGAGSGVEAPVPFHAALRYHSLSLEDSTAVVSENHVTLAAGSQLPVFDVALDVDASVDLSTVTTSAPVSLSLVRLTVASPEWKWNTFMLRVAVNGYAVKGMMNQQGNYLYPDIRLSHLLFPGQAVFLGFHPAVSFATLREQTREARYLSGSSAIRHSVDRLMVSGGLESSWSDQFTTKLTFAFRQVTDHALYADETNSGIGTLAYGGTTSIASVRADAVANITPNDYFAIALTARSTKNDISNHSVPYLPGFEISATHRHRFPFDLSVTASISAYGSRRASVLATRTVAGGFWSGLRAEYEAMPRLALFVNFENLFNRRDEVWKGYRIEPFRADIGVSFRW